MKKILLMVTALMLAATTAICANVLRTGIAPVPELASMLLLGSGLIGLATIRKRFWRPAAAHPEPIADL